MTLALERNTWDSDSHELSHMYLTPCPSPCDYCSGQQQDGFRLLPALSVQEGVDRERYIVYEFLFKGIVD